MSVAIIGDRPIFELGTFRMQVRNFTTQLACSVVSYLRTVESSTTVRRNDKKQSSTRYVPIHEA